MTVSDIAPGYISGNFFCVKNVGSQAVTISASADELTDLDIACTGDEAAHGDTTCGGSQAGELAGVLNVSYTDPDCSNPASGSSVNTGLAENATTPHGLGGLEPGATRCFHAGLIYPTGLDADAVQRAQSDKVTWRFKFSAVTAE